MNLVPEAENSGMLKELKKYVSRLNINAESLIENKTNNVCEQFNAIINKHIAGKRLNFREEGVITLELKQLLSRLILNNFYDKFIKKHAITLAQVFTHNNFNWKFKLKKIFLCFNAKGSMERNF